MIFTQSQRRGADGVSAAWSTLFCWGGEATKEKVLRRINDASLVQIAAHGDAERGEIALTPNSSVIGVPMKDDVVLTVKRMAVVGIRAKLVVLLKLLSQCKGEDPKS